MPTFLVFTFWITNWFRVCYTQYNRARRSYSFLSVIIHSKAPCDSREIKKACEKPIIDRF